MSLRRVLVVDDEPLARQRLARLLERSDEFELCGDAADGVAALQAAAALGPDIVLLDIRMPRLDGLAVARRMADWPTPPAIIFCTAYDEYSLAAFDAAACAYLLKPVRAEQLAAALARAITPTRAQLAALARSGANAAEDYLTVRNARGVRRVALDDVRCLVADSKYVVATCSDGEFLLDTPLKTLESQYPDHLVRVHRNCLVVAACLQGIQRDRDGQYRAVLLDCALEPAVSRRHLPAVRRLLGD